MIAALDNKNVSAAIAGKYSQRSLKGALGLVSTPIHGHIR
jgi:hypothetical protein